MIHSKCMHVTKPDMHTYNTVEENVESAVQHKKTSCDTSTSIRMHICIFTLTYISHTNQRCRSKKKLNQQCNTTKTSCTTGRSRQHILTSLNVNQSASKPLRACAGTYLKDQLQPTRSGRLSKMTTKSNIHLMGRRSAPCKCL